MWKKPANFLTFLFGVIPPVRCYPLLRYVFRFLPFFVRGWLKILPHYIGMGVKNTEFDAKFQCVEKVEKELKRKKLEWLIAFAHS